jgi:putative PIN family toxin of toxin-antitoxin system
MSCRAPHSALADVLVSNATPRRVVFDTNVLLSLYLFADSRFAPLRVKVEAGQWQALSNEACLDEFRRVLAYPEFARDAETQATALTAYAALVNMVEPASLARFELPRCKDRDDQKFLELARDGAAELLITADKALLILARRQKMAGRFRIITPEQALAELAT